MERIKELLREIGLQSDRVKMVNLSSAMAGRFAESAQSMVDQVRRLGPNPLRSAAGGRPE